MCFKKAALHTSPFHHSYITALESFVAVPRKKIKIYRANKHFSFEIAASVGFFKLLRIAAPLTDSAIDIHYSFSNLSKSFRAHITSVILWIKAHALASGDYKEKHNSWIKFG